MNRPAKPAKTAELAAAESVVLEHLAAGRYEEAARAVAHYESDQPTPRGIGIDWRNPNLRGEVAGLRSILHGTSAASIEVRIAAAMMFLWGVSRPYRRWLARSPSGDAEALELVLRAFRARQEDHVRDARERGFIP